jgi:hypothetical protein
MMKIYIAGDSKDKIIKAKAELKRVGVTNILIPPQELSHLNRGERINGIGECDGAYILKGWEKNIEQRWDVHEAQRLYKILWFESEGDLKLLKENSRTR